jgi:hypothetical protein
MDALINAGDIEGDCNNWQIASQKLTSFVAGGPNTTGEKWPKCDASYSQTAAYFPANSILNRALVQKNTDATKKCIDRGHYFCVGRSKYFKVFPLSNQGPDHTLEAVDKQQWFWPLACGLQLPWRSTDLDVASMTWNSWDCVIRRRVHLGLRASRGCLD